MTYLDLAVKYLGATSCSYTCSVHILIDPFFIKYSKHIIDLMSV